LLPGKLDSFKVYLGGQRSWRPDSDPVDAVDGPPLDPAVETWLGRLHMRQRGQRPEDRRRWRPADHRRWRPADRRRWRPVDRRRWGRGRPPNLQHRIPAEGRRRHGRVDEGRRGRPGRLGRRGRSGRLRRRGRDGEPHRVPGPYQREDIRVPEFGRETPAHAQKPILKENNILIISFWGGGLGFCEKLSRCDKNTGKINILIFVKLKTKVKFSSLV
jgi:hypothetical protein